MLKDYLKRNTTHLEKNEHLDRVIFVLYTCLHQKKKANIPTLARCILFWKVDLKNAGEEGSHKLFYFNLKIEVQDL